MNAGSSTSYRRAAGETTEWEDILRSKGIIPPSEHELEQKKKAEEAVAAEAERAAAAYDPLTRRTLEELDEVGEGEEYADSRALEAYRQARIAQLKQTAERNKFGSLLPLSRDDFVREVTEGSKAAWVVLLLYKDVVPDSKLVLPIFHRLAAKHRATKFMAIVSDKCIEGYPDANVPTAFVYHDGAVVKQLVGVAPFGGPRVNDDTIEWVLAQHGAVSTELDEDPRDKLERSGGGGGFGRGRGGFGRGGEDDDEDD